jgi:hypothetical protein
MLDAQKEDEGKLLTSKVSREKGKKNPIKAIGDKNRSSSFYKFIGLHECIFC